MDILKINNFEFVGDSLSAININFNVLDLKLKELVYNTDKKLMPYVNFFKQNERKLRFLIDVFYDKKPAWDNMVTLVSTNSSKWIKPIVFIDPNIYSFPSSNSQSTINEIVENFKYFYPLFNNSNQTIPNYVENQKAIVYYYVNHKYNTVVINDTVNSDFANCVSQGTKTAILNCQNKTGYSKTFCNGTELTCLGCDGTPCQQEISVSCVYPETNRFTTNRYIQAIIRSNFEDIAEKEIKTIFLTVKNCSWVVERIL